MQAAMGKLTMLFGFRCPKGGRLLNTAFILLQPLQDATFRVDALSP